MLLINVLLTALLIAAHEDYLSAGKFIVCLADYMELLPTF